MTIKNIAPILTGFLIATGAGVLIAHAQDYTPLAPLPIGAGGAKLTSYTLTTYLAGMLKLIIALGAVLSVFVAIVGGTQYVASGIAPSAKQDAKERIANALIGLALVLASYLILNSISPNLVAFDFGLPPVGTEVTPAGPAVPAATCPTPNDTSEACCPTGIACHACSGCSVVTGVAHKPCGSGTTCFLNTTLLSKLQRVSGVSNWQVTETWPPTVRHVSRCHQDGTCADVNNSGGSTAPATIKTYYDAFQAAGLAVTYENINCAPYIAVGVTNCGSFETQTNTSSFHVK